MLRENHRAFARTLLARAALWLGVAVLTAAGAAAVELDYVIVGSPGNPVDPQNPHGLPNVGSVAYAYRIGRYEVTNAQYAEFLNAKAASDPYGLFDGRMENDLARGGIEQDGSAGSYTYTVRSGFASKPVVYANFFDAARFANWLHNGQGSGDTETGAYLLAPNPDFPPIPANAATLARQPAATVFLPNENEWYKAAYYQNDGTYRSYPTRSATAPTAEAPPGGSNSANFNGALSGGNVTPVGAYGQSPGPFGTFDQGGNAAEWIEAFNQGYRVIRGGHFNNGAAALASFERGYGYANEAYEHSGFRLATSLPPPDVPPVSRGTWRILPLGDSLTQATLPQLSYRYNLWIKLLDAGVNFDFVGSLTDNAGSGGNDPANWLPHLGRSFDQHHEGRSGKRTDEIVAGLPTWMFGYTPDMVLLLAGTNDAIAGSRPATAVRDDLGAIITLLRGKNPNVIVFLATILPTADSVWNGRVNEINATLPDLLSQSTASSPIVLVDQNAGFNVATDSYDGLHPNAAGEEKLAKKWLEAMQVYTLRSTNGADVNGHLTVTFLRLQSPSQLTYTVEVSGNLQQWFSGPAETVEAGVVNHSNGTETVTVRDLKSPATDGQRFIRLRLSY